MFQAKKTSQWGMRKCVILRYSDIFKNISSGWNNWITSTRFVHSNYASASELISNQATHPIISQSKVTKNITHNDMIITQSHRKCVKLYELSNII